jgi:2'-5' RNA ligase
MRLHASIRPPAAATAHLEAALRPEFVHAGQVAWIPAAHWRLHLAGFGNVVHADALRLADVLTEHVRECPAPTLRLSGVSALPEDGDDSIWASVTGDREPIAELAAMIPGWVREFGFVLDRRAYRPRVQIGKITAVTTAHYLEGLVGRLGSYHGGTWRADGVTLGHEESGSSERDPSFEVLQLAGFAGTARSEGGAPAETG